MAWWTPKLKPGQLLIELLVAMGIAAILLPAFLTGLIASREGKAQQPQRNLAVARLQEAVEALRSVREQGWITFASNGTFHPVNVGGQWQLVAGSETTSDGITRSVVIDDVYRDGAGNIISSGGTYDPSIKKATIATSWTQPVPSTQSATIYLSRYLDNINWSQTTAAEFNTGILSNVAVTNSAGGEVELGQNTKAKWCTPAFSSSTIDLPDGPPVAVAARPNASTSNPNDVLVATAPNSSSSIKMAYINVTANTDPPVSSLHGIFTLDAAQYSAPGYVPTGIGLDNSFKTNDIKYYTSSTGKLYALLATDRSDREVVAVQVDDTNLQDPVNKIYKYWTYFNTKIYGAAFNSPSANAADSGGDGNGYQTNATNAYANDGNLAVDTNSGSNTGTNCTGADKDKHRFYDFGFAVPSGATINGIEVNLSAKADNTTGTPKICVQLSWDGGTTWTAAKTSNNLTTSLASYTLGGAADTWGRTWSYSNFTDANFRMRIINVASNTSRDFSLDWVGAKVYYNGISSLPNDQAPFGYGAKSIAVLGDTGYVSSGGYLYTFDLANIDSKSPSNSLDQIGCRIQLDGYDCSPGTGTDKKYSAGEVGSTWSDTTSPAHNDCSDGGNIELYANNDLTGVQVGGNKYVYVAVGAGTNPEFEIVNTTSVPDAASSPSISSASCGRISGGNSGWKVTSSLDFNSQSGTEEAANSVYAKSDGTRAYISSNGGIDGNNNGQPDSKQFYVINTSNKSSPAFLSGTSATGATSGFYYGSGANAELYPRRSLTVLNGDRVVLVGKDGVANGNDAEEYQVLNSGTEASPTYCGGINYDQGFNDLTAVAEADGDNFVYMVANTTLNELKIIQGGPDGAYNDSGNYQSRVLDLGYATASNYLSGTVTAPANTTVQAQVAVADPANGNCATATYTYVGPGGSSSTFFDAVGSSLSASIPIGAFAPTYQNPGRCLRYKVYFSTTDYNQTPKLFDALINYSP